jgi:hypothetical protein
MIRYLSTTVCLVFLLCGSWADTAHAGYIDFPVQDAPQFCTTDPILLDPTLTQPALKLFEVFDNFRIRTEPENLVCSEIHVDREIFPKPGSSLRFSSESRKVGANPRPQRTHERPDQGPYAAATIEVRINVDGLRANRPEDGYPFDASSSSTRIFRPPR